MGGCLSFTKSDTGLQALSTLGQGMETNVMKRKPEGVSPDVTLAWFESILLVQCRKFYFSQQHEGRQEGTLGKGRRKLKHNRNPSWYCCPEKCLLFFLSQQNWDNMGPRKSHILVFQFTSYSRENNALELKDVPCSPVYNSEK